MKRKVKIYLAVFCVFLFTCCATIGPHKNNKIVPPNIDLDNAGIIIGRVTKQRFFGLGMYNLDMPFGRDICFRNIMNDEQIVYGFAEYFYLMLPAGEYEFYGIGNPTARLLIPLEEGFSFTVRNGEIKYIGSVVSDRDLKKYIKRIGHDSENYFRQKVYGLTNKLTIISTTFERHGKPKSKEKACESFLPFFVIDERNEVINKFYLKYPHFKDKTVIVDLMK